MALSCELRTGKLLSVVIPFSFLVKCEFCSDRVYFGACGRDSANCGVDLPGDCCVAVWCSDPALIL